MPNHIYVYCRSADLLEYRDVFDRIETAYFEHCKLDPPNVGAQETNTDWMRASIQYDAGKPPIELERVTSRAEIDEVVDEAIDELKAVDKTGSAELIARLRETKQLFHFEFRDIPEDGWEMLDETESMLAKELDGIIQAAEGFYDASLAPLLLLGDDGNA